SLTQTRPVGYILAILDICLEISKQHIRQRVAGRILRGGVKCHRTLIVRVNEPILAAAYEFRSELQRMRANYLAEIVAELKCGVAVPASIAFVVSGKPGNVYAWTQRVPVLRIQFVIGESESGALFNSKLWFSANPISR